MTFLNDFFLFQSCLSSEKFSRLDEPILRLHISTESPPAASSIHVASPTKTKNPTIQLEMNKIELDAFVTALEKIEEKLNLD